MSLAATAPLCLDGSRGAGDAGAGRSLFVWGSNAHGQCLRDDGNVVLAPREVQCPSSVRSFAAGWDQSVLVDCSGSLWAGGACRESTLSDAEAQPCASLARVQHGELEGMLFEAAQAGRDHVLAVLEGGETVLSWGSSNEFGQLGQGTASSSSVRPGVVNLGAVPVRQVCCGEFHSLVLTVHGEVFAFGDNTHGALGVGQQGFCEQAVHVNSGHLRGTPVRAIAAGSQSSMAMSVGGRVFSWGCNSRGRLGLGPRMDTESEVWLPLAVPTLPGTARSIAAGSQHSAVILRKGRLFLTGDNRWGQLGQPQRDFDWTSTFYELPFREYTLRVRMVALGSKHTLILSYTGELYTCGHSAEGQLGTGEQCPPDGTIVDLPRQVHIHSADIGPADLVVCGIDSCHNHNVVLALRGKDAPSMPPTPAGGPMPAQASTGLAQTTSSPLKMPLMSTIQGGGLRKGALLGATSTALASGCTSRLSRPRKLASSPASVGIGGNSAAGQPEEVKLLQPVVQAGVASSAGFAGLSVSSLGVLAAALGRGGEEGASALEELRCALCMAYATPALLNASFCFPGLYRPRLDAGDLLRVFEDLYAIEDFHTEAFEAQVIRAALAGLGSWAEDHEKAASLVHRDQLRGLAALLISPVLSDATRPETYNLMARVMNLVAWMLPEGRRELQEIIIDDCSEEKVLRHCLVKRVREHCDETLRRAHQAQRLSREIWEGLMLMQLLWGANEAIARRLNRALQVQPEVLPESDLGMSLTKTLSQFGAWRSALGQTLTATQGTCGATGRLQLAAMASAPGANPNQAGELLDRLTSFSAPSVRPPVPAAEFHLQALAEELVPPELEFQLFMENASSGPITPAEVVDLPLIAARTEEGFEYIMPSRMRSFMVNRNLVPVSYTRKVLQVENHHSQVYLQHQVARRIAEDLEVLPGHEIHIDPALLFFILKVRRDHLLEDTLERLQAASPEDLRRQLKVVFDGEQGVDEGGLAREFFRLLGAELFATERGLFDPAVAQSSRVLWFDRASKREARDFWLAGVVIGLAIYNSMPGLNIKFPPVIFKKIKDEPLTLDDLRELHPDTHLSLRSLLQWQPPSASMTPKEASDLFEQTFCLDFTVSYEGENGAMATRDLCPGGKDRAVSLENREEFVRLYCEWLMSISVEQQFEPFRDGVRHVCDSPLFCLLDSGELGLIACGEQDLDFRQLQKNIRLEGYAADSPYVQAFWDVVLGFDAVQKKLFLSFVTGSDLAPVGGLQDLEPLVLQRNGGEPTERLPTAHTCFNHLLLPEYDTPEKLKRMLTTAMHNAEGFGLE